jgi:7-cyano-7-deazaguanine reductase
VAPHSEPAADDLTILGQDMRGPSRRLETFPAPETITWVALESSELTSFCPVTGQPDFSSVSIGYQPNGRCLESKSLKLYLWSFRDEPIFGEGIADRIARDVAEATAARRVEVVLRQNIRGGISITARAEIADWPREG